MKIKRLHQKTFILLLAFLHAPFLFEAVWYDEAAVLANAKIVSFSEYFHGLNWLQTIPFGYFLLIKNLIQIENGILFCRITSLIFLIMSLLLIDKEYLAKLRNQWFSYITIAILMINSFSLRYGTDVKPYTLEMLLSVSLLFFAKREKTFAILILSALIPFFSSTSFVIGVPALLIYGYRYKKKAYFIAATNLILMMLLVSRFVPTNTKYVMSTEWFGDSKPNVILGLKSFFGGIFWLPTSGTGWLSDDLTTSYQYKYEFSIFVFLITSFIILLKQIRNSDLYVLIVSSFMLITLNILRLLPAAGRLVQGFAILFSVLLVNSIDTFKNRKIFAIIASILVATSIFTNYRMKVANFTPLIYMSKINTKFTTYSNLDTAPEIQYAGNRRTIIPSTNLLSISTSRNLIGCRSKIFHIGDRFYLRTKPKLMAPKIRGFIYQPLGRGFGFYLAKENQLILQDPNAARKIECLHQYRNPEKGTAIK